VRISVIIPAYNAQETIGRCIDSVLDNDYNNFEVIVVDDHSSDRTAEIVRAISADRRLRIMNLSLNSGPAHSRNTGIRSSDGEVLLFLDSDSYVQKDWVRRHADLHKMFKADIIGGGICSVCNTAFGRSDGFCNWWTSIPHSKDGYVKKLHLPTNNLSLRRSVFNRVGYLDEALISGEDAEFFFRAHRNGLKIYFKSDLTVYHSEKDTLSGFLRHQAKWGEQFFQMRRKRKMEYHYLVPDSSIKMYIYALPLAIAMTLFVVYKWLKYKPSVLFYVPLIFIGKCSHIAAVREAFFQSRREGRVG